MNTDCTLPNETCRTLRVGEITFEYLVVALGEYVDAGLVTNLPARTYATVASEWPVAVAARFRPLHRRLDNWMILGQKNDYARW
ncbi:MAG: hypothetical protein HY258_08860, partial [Chloroflexi bacterium]|nr:hypothetical protein [Chloroflexota bacterium]